ncbi:hypothetical protein ANCCAN_16280 [Ancylostoma caninum]|uniref:Uncharacterized protein n=1 Tax=Ancylostoma caninum TaxID=29170 RepID=A0A368G009_ANCCA|nr:hypothetical protein ANCCAN_16280 [Ancylostoma caninum]
MELYQKKGNESIDLSVYKLRYGHFYKAKDGEAYASSSVHTYLVVDQECYIKEGEVYVMGCPKYSECHRGFLRLRDQLKDEEKRILKEINH